MQKHFRIQLSKKNRYKGNYFEKTTSHIRTKMVIIITKNKQTVSITIWKKQTNKQKNNHKKKPTKQLEEKLGKMNN